MNKLVRRSLSRRPVMPHYGVDGVIDGRVEERGRFRNYRPLGSLKCVERRRRGRAVAVLSPHRSGPISELSTIGNRPDTSACRDRHRRRQRSVYRPTWHRARHHAHLSYNGHGRHNGSEYHHDWFESRAESYSRWPPRRHSLRGNEQRVASEDRGASHSIQGAAWNARLIRLTLFRW